MKLFKLKLTKVGAIHINNEFYHTKKEAVEMMLKYVEDNNHFISHDENNNLYLTPFDFKLEEVDTEIYKIITCYNDATNYLHIEKTQSEVNKSHDKLLSAIDKLITIAEAWNKIDDFVPNYTEENDKWFPCFIYDSYKKEFDTTEAIVVRSIIPCSGLNIYFRTKELAEQFGELYIDLWNEYFLNK